MFISLNNIRKQLPLIALIIGILSVMGGLQMFYKGYHNLDTGHNMEYLEASFNKQFIDYTSDGNYLDGMELYRLGSYQIEYGLYLGLLGAFLIGFGVVGCKYP
jgi:hypothetical protein